MIQVHVYGQVLQFLHPKTRRLVRRGIKKLRYSSDLIERFKTDVNTLINSRCERLEDAPRKLCNLAYEAYFAPIYRDGWDKKWQKFLKGELVGFRPVEMIFKITPPERITQLENELDAAKARIAELETQLTSLASAQNRGTSPRRRKKT